MVPGLCYLKESGPRKHLHLVLSEPDDEGFFVVVSFSDVAFAPPNALVIRPEDNVHPFITKPTAVMCRYSRIEKAALVADRITNRTYDLQPIMSLEIAREVLNHLLWSKHTTPEVKRWCDLDDNRRLLPL